MIKVLVTLLFLTGCTTIKIPADFVYKEVETRDFTLASWQKVTNPAAPYKIYIEGDGYAFNARGKVTQDPTPRGTLVRELAFGDDSPNVIYLARPCQYIKSPIVQKDIGQPLVSHWKLLMLNMRQLKILPATIRSFW